MLGLLFWVAVGGVLLGRSSQVFQGFSMNPSAQASNLHFTPGRVGLGFTSRGVLSLQQRLQGDECSLSR